MQLKVVLIVVGAFFDPLFTATAWDNSDSQLRWAESFSRQRIHQVARVLAPTLGAILRKMVLDSVQSRHTRRNYAKALDHLFQSCASQPLSRALLTEWRAGMESLSPSTVNVRLSAVLLNMSARSN
jgi:hypothetical protein